MVALVNYPSIEKIQIKVLIKSIYNPNDNVYSYNLFFSPTYVGYEILHLSFKKLCEQFHISVWNGYISDCREETELTSAFCVYANRITQKNSYVIGNKDECIIDYLSLKQQLSSNIRTKVCPAWGFYNLFVKNESEDSTKEYELLVNLRNSINKRESAQHRKYLLLNRYRYSLVVYEMIKKKVIEIDDFIPILDKYYVVDYYTSQKEELYWAETQSLFEYDIFPLDLAYMAQNSEFIFYLLEKGATKFSKGAGVRQDGSSVQSDFIIFMFENAKNISEVNLVLNFINSHSEQIEKETKIVTAGEGYSSREFIYSRGGENIIRTWYKCILRLQSIENLEFLLLVYRRQILGLLNTVNPYTGNWLSLEKETPSIDMDLEINQYIKNNIVPHIKSAKFKHITPKDYGIWGFDARTGAPIYEKDLFV